MTGLDRADLWLDQAVGHHVEGDLDASEALALTAKIKAYVGVTWILLSEAHNRRADKALGYDSWAAYVKAEFDMSRAHAYRLVAHAQAVYELAGAAGMGDVSPMGDIPERTTRGVDTEALAEEVAAEASNLPTDATDEERAEVVRSALARQTTKTETTTTTFDPETGEITETSGGEGTPDRAASHVPGDEGTVPSPSPSVPPVDPALRLMADLSARRAEVAKWLAFDRHEQVIGAMTPEQRSDYRSFVLSVSNHAVATLELLSTPARLKAVN